MLLIRQGKLDLEMVLISGEYDDDGRGSASIGN
jgi:hypothetical protein